MLHRFTFSAFVIVAVAFLPAGVASAADCDNAANQNEMNRCAEDRFKTADDALNAQYKDVRKVLGDDQGAQKLLVTAQKAWIGFRDAHCAVVAHTNEGGSMEPLMRFSCLADVTEQRTKQLKDLANDYGR